MRKTSLLVLCFYAIATPTLSAQKIFKDGLLFFRNGETKKVLVLKDSYQGYAKSVIDKYAKNGVVQQAGFVFMKYLEEEWVIK